MKKLRRLFTAILIITIVLSITFVATATWGQKSITITYADVGIVANGKEIIPKDAYGNAVEPFLYDNTTYIPLRTIKEIVDCNVSWAPNNNTVYIITDAYSHYPGTTIPKYKRGVDADKEEINREEGYSAYFYNIKKQTEKEIGDYENLLILCGMEMEDYGDNKLFIGKDYKVTLVNLTDSNNFETYFCVLVTWDV
jgi:hypothetical protein